MYDSIEYCRQFIIKQFPKNRIVCFPQTVDFTETKFGRSALKKAVRVYGQHKNLTLSAREESSYKKFRQSFLNNKIVMAPDIVLSLNLSAPLVNREGITFALRADAEKSISESTQQELITKVSSKYLVRFYDTHITKSSLSIEERKNELDLIWNVFRKSEIVITDRLHGMIFCVITNTPCIAIDNSNKKVSGVYNAWIKDNSRIKIVEDVNVEKVMELINIIKKDDTNCILENYNSDHFRDFYNKILDDDN